MKLRYPAEAFALGIILFSGDMEAAFVSGTLVLLAVVFAQVLKDFLKDALPGWSLWPCVAVAAAAVCTSAFELAFWQLGLERDSFFWFSTAVIGLLAAKHVLMNELEADYGSLCYESALVWGFWILFAIGREFFATGGICGWPLMELEYRAASLQEPMFGFLAAGMTLAFVNGILKKNQITAESFWVVLPAILVTRPFTPARFGEAGGAVFAIAACLIMFLSVRKTLVFSRPGKAYRKMPVELISMGFIYMVLSVY